MFSSYGKKVDSIKVGLDHIDILLDSFQLGFSTWVFFSNRLLVNFSNRVTGYTDAFTKQSFYFNQTILNICSQNLLMVLFIRSFNLFLRAGALAVTDQ